MLLFPFIWKGPVWLVLLTTLSLVGVSTLILLSRVKGAVIGAEWEIQSRDKAPPAAEGD